MNSGKMEKLREKEDYEQLEKCREGEEHEQPETMEKLREKKEHEQLEKMQGRTCTAGEYGEDAKSMNSWRRCRSKKSITSWRGLNR